MCCEHPCALLCCALPSQPCAHRRCQGCSPCQNGKFPFLSFFSSPPIRRNWAHVQEALLQAWFCFALWLGLPLLPWQGLNLPNSVSHLLNGANSASFLLACTHGEPVDVQPLRAAAVPGPGCASCVVRRGCFLWASIPGAEGGKWLCSGCQVTRQHVLWCCSWDPAK